MFDWLLKDFHNNFLASKIGAKKIFVSNVFIHVETNERLKQMRKGENGTNSSAFFS